MRLDERLEYYATQIVDACYTVYKELGPGLLENIYKFCLMKELRIREIPYKSQVEIPLYYRGENTERTFKLDLLVADSIVLKLKSVETLLNVHKAQLITYLKLSHKQLGFLINFNVPVFKNGIKRVVF